MRLLLFLPDGTPVFESSRVPGGVGAVIIPKEVIDMGGKPSKGTKKDKRLKANKKKGK